MRITYMKLENDYTVLHSGDYKTGDMFLTQWGYRKIVSIYAQNISESDDMPYGC